MTFSNSTVFAVSMCCNPGIDFSLSVILLHEKLKKYVEGGEKTKFSAKFCLLNSPGRFFSI